MGQEGRDLFFQFMERIIEDCIWSLDHSVLKSAGYSREHFPHAQNFSSVFEMNKIVCYSTETVLTGSQVSI